MRMRDLKLQGPKLLIPSLYRDQRGFFLESYQKNVFKELGISEEFVQDNCSFSIKGVIRGMHFQKSPGQVKLVRAIGGRIYDVIVDIRLDSPTFGRWEGMYLDDQSCYELYIPIGFAHGFCVLSPSAFVLYKVSSLFSSKAERSFRYDDPEVGIKWPIENPIVSERDSQAPLFGEVEW